MRSHPISPVNAFGPPAAASGPSTAFPPGRHPEKLAQRAHDTPIRLWYRRPNRRPPPGPSTAPATAGPGSSGSAARSGTRLRARITANGGHLDVANLRAPATRARRTVWPGNHPSPRRSASTLGFFAGLRRQHQHRRAGEARDRPGYRAARQSRRASASSRQSAPDPAAACAPTPARPSPSSTASTCVTLGDEQSSNVVAHAPELSSASNTRLPKPASCSRGSPSVGSRRLDNRIFDVPATSPAAGSMRRFLHDRHSTLAAAWRCCLTHLVRR